jgi:hypothetical protein
MGTQKVILALALTMLIVGQHVGGAIVLDERNITPVLQGTRPAAQGPKQNTIPVQGSNFADQSGNLVTFPMLYNEIFDTINLLFVSKHKEESCGHR